MTRDRFASQRGISMVVVVIVVMVTIVLTAVSLLLYARLQQLQNVKEELKRLKKDEGRHLDALNEAIKKNLEATNLWQGGEPKDMPLTKPGEKLREYSTHAFSAMPEKLETLGDSKGKAEELDKRIEQACRDYGIYPTLQTLVEVQAQRLLYTKNLNDQLRLQVQIAEQHARAVQEMKAPVTERKENYKRYLTEQITEVNRKIQAEDSSFSTRKTELETARDAASKGIDDENARYFDWEQRRRNEIRELQRQLEELKIKEVIKFEINTVHGRVLRPDVPNKMAFVDIGSRDRVVPGLKFMAAKRGDQGKFVYKAELEVKKVWPTYSEVSIVRVLDDEVPVIDGDLILNPLFHTRRPIVVCFAGEEQPIKLRPAWSTGEATRRIREIGSEVRTGVTLDVDFLIFTEGRESRQQIAYPSFEKAVTLGIPTAEAAEIFQFLGD